MKKKQYTYLPEVLEIIKQANLFPPDYKFSFDDFPNFDAARQREYFFELVKTLPADLMKEEKWIGEIIDGKTIEAGKILEQTDHPFYAAARKKGTPLTHKTAWLEFFEDGEPMYPLSVLTKSYIRPALQCRDVLTLICFERHAQAIHTSGGKRALPEGLMKNCTLTSENGIIKIRSHYPLNVIINEGVDTDRIRVCPKCQRFFWAKRTDSQTCGKKKCVEGNGSKKYSEANKLKILRDKRKKYYESKEIAFCESCVYPLNTHGEADCKKNGGDNGAL